jgi:orotidine-5'-phosphate decarboxylase
MPLLIPGIGVQGGDIRATAQAGRTPDGRGMMINSARAILYASARDDWEQAAAKTARATRSAIRAALQD